MDSSNRKHELLRVIINAGLDEDLINWLRNRGYTDLYGRLDNVPLEILEEYFRGKKLSPDIDESELIREINELDHVDDKRGYIKAKSRGKHFSLKH